MAVYKTKNGGQSWDRTALRNIAISALYIDPKNPSTVYAGVQNGIYRSRNRGKKWKPLGPGLSGGVVSIAADPANSSTLYAVTTGTQGRGLYKSTDGGETWNRISGEGTLLGASIVATDFQNAGTVYVAGFPAGADVFVAKLNPSGSGLLFSTYIGGRLSDEAAGIALDQAGDIYITGWTTSDDLPLRNPLQTGNASDPFSKKAFVMKIDLEKPSLDFSSYLYGARLDTATAIAIDSSGNMYVTGFSVLGGLPLLNPVDATNSGTDAFVMKIRE